MKLIWFMRTGKINVSHKHGFRLKCSVCKINDIISLFDLWPHSVRGVLEPKSKRLFHFWNQMKHSPMLTNVLLLVSFYRFSVLEYQCQGRNISLLSVPLWRNAKQIFNSQQELFFSILTFLHGSPTQTKLGLNYK